VLSLGTIVKEVMKFLRASLPSNIKIEVNLASDTPNVLADPTQVHQVVMNLATNAFHAMEDTNGQLTANLDRFEPGAEFIRSHPEFRALAYARLILADTGHGMDARTLERIYEPFFTTKPLGKGTGLGLAVVHGIIRSHEGIISVESSVGQGTTFYLYLPAHTAGGTPVQKPNHSVAAGQGQRILFLDDEPVLTSLFQRQLQRLNYNVTTTNSAREAIGLVEKNPASFDLLITDLTMPEISGLEVARQIHRLRPDLPIILATGFNAALNENDLHSAGICKLMEKPITATALAATVARAIKKDDEPVPGGTEVPVG
jgi:CheY-like chemotaxis protein